jgi:hypothetical protein
LVSALVYIGLGVFLVFTSDLRCQIRLRKVVYKVRLPIRVCLQGLIDLNLIVLYSVLGSWLKFYSLISFFKSIKATKPTSLV